MSSSSPLRFCVLALFVAFAAPARAAEPVLDLATCVRLALENDPEIAVAEVDIQRAEAALLLEQSRFDWLLEAALAGGETRLPQSLAEQADNGDLASLDTQTLNYSLNTAKTFASGLQFSQDLQVTRADTNLLDTTTKTKGSLVLELRYPLLRGRGRALVLAPQQAATADREASLLELNQRIADRIYTAAAGYWRYSAAFQQLRVIEESEQRSQKLVTDTRRLIEAGEVPQNELLQLLANQAEKRANRIAARNELFQARQNLYLVLGLTHAQSAALQQAPGDFPADAGARMQALPSHAALTDFALATRPDYRALGQRLEGEQLRRKAAADGLKGDLSVAVNAGYSTLREGSGGDELVAALTGETPGAETGVSLRYQLPLQRRAAKARLTEARAQVALREIARNDLSRQIGLEVLKSREDLLRTHEELTAVDESVEYYELAVKNERKKLTLGFSTLIDLISYEDRLTAAQSNQIAVRARFWQALAKLQLEIGAFHAGRALDLSADDLLTLPQP